MTTRAPSPQSPLPSRASALAHIRADAAAHRFTEWGQSTLIDEHTGVPSIDQELFDALHAAAGIAAAFPIGNAGVIHVYGYWFSEVPTPFGLKRARWADGALAAAFGLPRDAFHLTGSPAARPSGAPAPTPLQRVAAAMRATLESPPPGALVADAEIPGRSVTGAGARPGAGTSIPPQRSRVVLQRPHDRLPWALSYGIAAPGAAADAPLQLLTAFPVQGDPAALIAEFAAHPALRWNAVSNS